MFGLQLGAFRASLVNLGGRAWKIPYKLNKTRKANVRKRLAAVDNVIKAVVDSGVNFRLLEHVKKMPTATEMAPRDKYTTFSKKGRNYRKGIHKVPNFTKVPLPRTSPVGF